MNQRCHHCHYPMRVVGPPNGPQRCAPRALGPGQASYAAESYRGSSRWPKSPTHDLAALTASGRTTRRASSRGLRARGRGLGPTPGPSPSKAPGYNPAPCWPPHAHPGCCCRADTADGEAAWGHAPPPQSPGTAPAGPCGTWPHGAPWGAPTAHDGCCGDPWLGPWNKGGLALGHAHWFKVGGCRDGDSLCCPSPGTEPQGKPGCSPRPPPYGEPDGRTSSPRCCCCCCHCPGCSAPICG